MQMHDVGTFYWGILDFPEGVGDDRPRFETCRSSELEYPHRFGVGFAIRLTKRKSLVVGQWVKQAIGDGEVTAHLERAVRTATFGIKEPTPEEMEEYGLADYDGEALQGPIWEW